MGKLFVAAVLVGLLALGLRVLQLAASIALLYVAAAAGLAALVLGGLYLMRRGGNGAATR